MTSPSSAPDANRPGAPIGELAAHLEAGAGPVYENEVLRHGTAADLVVWLKGADVSDARGLLTPTAVQGSFAFTGTLPATAEGAATSFAGDGFIGYAHPGPALELPEGTLIVFVLPAAGSLAASRGIIARKRTGPDPHTGDIHLVWAGSSGELVFEIHEGDRFHQCRVSGALREGRPSCIVATWGRNGMTLRVDRSPVMTDAHTGGVPLTQKEDWLVGAAAFAGNIGLFWAGLISHIQIYRRQLSEAELEPLCPAQPQADEPAAERAVIVGLDPTLYLPLTGDIAADVAGHGLPVEVAGAPRSKGPGGWHLGGTSHIVVPHHRRFEADDGEPRRWIDSAVALCGEFAVHDLSRRQYLLAKASGRPGERFDNSLWIYVEPDGSLWAEVERPDARRRVGTRPRLVRPGALGHVGLLLGREGMTLLHEGRVCNDGHPRVLDFHGWDHRIR
ncbi:MAG: LamG-like jellyroll fold domain-containing protein, partial [Geminicoccaceae bacterium]|nr:LamG-like jellyroll fold domain-containing protein [Geminicoccaceae bacterium]